MTSQLEVAKSIAASRAYSTEDRALLRSVEIALSEQRRARRAARRQRH